MGRHEGKPMYGPKSVNGSHYLTRVAAGILRRAQERTGRSASDLIEHAIREALTGISKAETDEVAKVRQENDVRRVAARVARALHRQAAKVRKGKKA